MKYCVPSVCLTPGHRSHSSRNYDNMSLQCSLLPTVCKTKTQTEGSSDWTSATACLTCCISPQISVSAVYSHGKVSHEHTFCGHSPLIQMVRNSSPVLKVDLKKGREMHETTPPRQCSLRSDTSKESLYATNLSVNKPVSFSHAPRATQTAAGRKTRV